MQETQLQSLGWEGPLEEEMTTHSNTVVGGHSLLQGTFPTQGLNPGLLHCRQILYHMSLRESHHLCD